MLDVLKVMLWVVSLDILPSIVTLKIRCFTTCFSVGLLYYMLYYMVYYMFYTC
jgi:hypothetical protein